MTLSEEDIKVLANNMSEDRIMLPSGLIVYKKELLHYILINGELKRLD